MLKSNLFQNKAPFGAFFISIFTAFIYNNFRSLRLTVMNFKEALIKHWNYNLDQNLTFWTQKLGSEVKALYRLRNSSIEKTVNEYCQTLPHLLFYPKIHRDIATCESRAEHYGVSVGSVIREFKKPRSDYNSNLAKIKREVHSLAIEFDLINHGKCL